MKRRNAAQPTQARATARANLLIELMLNEMQEALENPSVMENPEWDRIFGNKQSLVVNLQKLVQALSALPEPKAKKKRTKKVAEEPLSAEEMGLLSAWLKEGS